MKKVEHELFGPTHWLAVNVKNCDKGPPKNVLIWSEFRRDKNHTIVLSGFNYFNHFGVFLHRQRHATDVRYRNDATSDLWATHSRGWGYISTT